jgi:hypothetical protein
MRAATSTLERIRRQALRDRLAWAALSRIGRLLTYSVGDHVWVLFGHKGLQLARVKMANPVVFDGTGVDWWWVDVYWPTRGLWIGTHRRVLRALTPPELHAVRETGVVEERAS